MSTKHNLRIVAAVAAAGFALTACGSTTSSSASGGSSSDCTSGQKLAYLGATTGDYGALGQNMVGGIKLALDDYNKTHSDCTVDVQVFDSQGDPDKATPLATEIVGDDSIVGLVGPGFSGESLATGKTFEAAGLPVISPSATNVTITQQGWSVWHRVIGNDSAQGAAAATYITDTAGASKVFVIDDGSDYGKGLASYVKKGLGSKVVKTDTVQTGQTDFSASVTSVTSSGADAVFYGGYYAEAGLLVKQLRQAGYKGLFMSGDGSEDPAFVKAAGAQAANDAVLTAPAGPAPGGLRQQLPRCRRCSVRSVLHAGLRRGEHLPGRPRRREVQSRGHERVHRLLHRRRCQWPDRVRPVRRHQGVGDLRLPRQGREAGHGEPDAHLVTLPR